MKFSKFQFECVWNQEAYLQPFPGSTLRGALGKSLKELICTIKHQRCENCLLNRHCLYAQIFETARVTDSKINQSSIPHPYLLEWLPDISGTYKKGDPFRFSLILFGKFINSLPYFVYAIEKMGQSGLGRKGSNGKRPTMALKSVYFKNQKIFDSTSPSLPDEIPFDQLSLQSSSGQHVLVSDELKISLITPLRIKKEGRLSRDLDFPTFMRAVTRRIDGLWKYYSDEEPRLNRDQIMSTARAVETTHKEINWIEQRRYSNRQSAAMNMGGMGGEIAFKGDFATLLPLIKIAESVHVGKSTSFGLGKYVIMEN